MTLPGAYLCLLYANSQLQSICERIQELDMDASVTLNWPEIDALEVHVHVLGT